VWLFFFLTRLLCFLLLCILPVFFLSLTLKQLTDTWLNGSLDLASLCFLVLLPQVNCSHCRLVDGEQTNPALCLHEGHRLAFSISIVVSAANKWRTLYLVFYNDRGEHREFAHFMHHTHTHTRTFSETFHLHRAAALHVSSGKWRGSVIAYISLSLVGISTAVSVFTVKAPPVALLLSLPANEIVACYRNV